MEPQLPAATPPWQGPEPIELAVDGQTVRGEITRRTAHVLAVRILHPYLNLHADAACGCCWHHWPDYRGPEGDARARELLTQCYRLGRDLEPQLARLQAAWVPHRAGLDQLPQPPHYGREAFLAWRRHQRAELKRGTLTGPAYQRALAGLRKAHRDHDWQREQADERFLAAHFPGHAWLENLVGQVVPLLEGGLPLRCEPAGPGDEGGSEAGRE